jgi:hypothetical protein
MADPFPLAAATDEGISVLLVAAIGAAGVIVGAALTPISEWISRKDKMKGYKRNVYRNFLDHAYWYANEDISDKKRQERAEKYVADYHRILMIAGPTVQAVITEDLKEPGSLTPEIEKRVLAAFKAELGKGGLP